MIGAQFSSLRLMPPAHAGTQFDEETKSAMAYGYGTTPSGIEQSGLQ
jgi:hypothetical protein